MRKLMEPIWMLLLCATLGAGTVRAFPVADTSADAHGVQQTGKCSGVVKDASGETIIGASVRVKDTNNGVITDLDGKFELNNVPLGAVLEVTYVGYQPFSVEWKGEPLTITLKEDSELLDEVVVVGYSSF